MMSEITPEENDSMKLPHIAENYEIALNVEDYISLDKSIRKNSPVNEQSVIFQDEIFEYKRQKKDTTIFRDVVDKDLACPSSHASEKINEEQGKEDNSDRNRFNDIICNLTMVLEAVATQGTIYHNENLDGNADVSGSRVVFFEMTSSFLQRVRDLNVYNHDRSEVNTLRDTIAAHLENCSIWRNEVGMDGAGLERCKRVLGEALLILDEKYTILERPNVRRIPCESDFGFVRVLNRGTFGQVLLAKTMYPRETYCAVKVMSKRRLLSSHMALYIVREREVMLKTNRCPQLFPRLLSSFQDEERLFLVMEYVQGGDCLMLLTAMGTIPEYLVRHFVKETCMAVDFLHKHRIVHRDIKADNLLLTTSGHVKLGDFGLCNHLPSRSHPPTQTIPYPGALTSDDNVGTFRLNDRDIGLLYTIVGNTCYQAPEMLSGTGYDEGADWWAVGVLTFHLLSAVTPFEDPEDMDNTVTNILLDNANVAALPPGLSYECVTFISELLVFDRYRRMGGYRNWNQALQHNFLNGIDLKSIYSRPGPFLPQMNPGLCKWIKDYSNARLYRLDALIPNVNKGLGDECNSGTSRKPLDDHCFETFSYICTDFPMR